MKVFAAMLTVLAGLGAGPLAAQPVDTAFTYQGRLQDAGTPANGPYDFRFILFDAPVGGSQIGPIVFRDDIVPADGLFTVSLDFGTSAFTGNKRWLDIAVRPGPSGGSYTALSERQELQSAPHSTFSLRSPWTGIAGKPAGFADDTDNDALGGLACANGQVAKWNGTAWVCAADADTIYSAGAGLDLTATTFSLADLGVTTPKLANNAITTPKLADGAVTSAKIADATVATADLASGAVTSSVIADGAVALTDLGQNGCGPNQILKWNGTAWACAADASTTYSAGAGLDLTGTVFSMADLGVTTPKIANLAVGTPKLADGAVTSAKIADGAVALADLGQNGCGPNQILKWNGTAWACAADADTNSGGTVTSVGTGAGLTGGPIASTGTVSVATGGIASAMLADGAVTSPKIANGAVGLAQINQGQVQARVTGTCPVGQYLRGINPDGTALCQPAAFVPNYITTLDDPAGFAGTHTSMAIGTDGLPIIGYHHAGRLKVAKCRNAACVSPPGNIISDVQSMSGSGGPTSIAIGSDGFPVISLHIALQVPPNPVVSHLKVVKCSDTTCTATPTLSIFPSEAGLGLYTSIAIGSDAFPVISYHNPAAGTLKVVKCEDAACTPGASSIATVDNNSSVGAHCSIAIGADALPIISYHDGLNGNLKVAKCVNAACTGTSILSTVDSDSNNVGLHTSIAVGTDGLPVISYQDQTAGRLKVVKCGNAACSTPNLSISTLDGPASFVGSFTSIAVGADGLPVISYHDGNAGSLKVAHCGDAACSADNSITTVDDNNVGSHTSIAIAPDGLPIVSYHDGNAGALKVAKCSTPSCR